MVLVPEEIYTKKGQTSEDSVLHQVLVYDIAQQKWALFIVALVDAAQYYNRIAHGIGAISLKASKVPESTVWCMLKLIREMEFSFKLHLVNQDLM